MARCINRSKQRAALLSGRTFKQKHEDHMLSRREEERVFQAENPAQGKRDNKEFEKRKEVH